MPDGAPDAGSYNDAGPEQIDAMVVGLTGHPCEELTPEAYGLQGETADQVIVVYRGGDCPNIYIPPKGGCEEAPDVQPIMSNIKFDGTMFVMAKDGGYSFKDGQMMFKSFEDICGEHPGTTVKAIGITLKPMASETAMQARIETGDLGQLLLRVHIWTGDGKIISIDGQEFLDLTAGMQVLVDGDLNIIEAWGENDQEGEAADMGMGSHASVGAPAGGCNAVPATQTGAYLDAVIPILMTMVIGRVIRAKVGGAMGIGGLSRVFALLQERAKEGDSLKNPESKESSNKKSRATGRRGTGSYLEGVRALVGQRLRRTRGSGSKGPSKKR